MYKRWEEHTGTESWLFGLTFVGPVNILLKTVPEWPFASEDGVYNLCSSEQPRPSREGLTLEKNRIKMQQDQLSVPLNLSSRSLNTRPTFEAEILKSEWGFRAMISAARTLFSTLFLFGPHQLAARMRHDPGRESCLRSILVQSLSLLGGTRTGQSLR